MNERTNRIDYQKTEKKLKDALILLMKEKSIERISVNEIASTATLSRGTFYLHFNDKYEMLESIESALFEELLDINKTFYTFDFLSHDENRPYPYFQDTYGWIKNNKVYFQSLLSENGNLLFVKKWKEYISQYFLETFRYNGVQFDDPDIVSVIVSSGLMDLIIYWINKREDLTPDDLSIIAGKFIHGIVDKFR